MTKDQISILSDPAHCSPGQIEATPIKMKKNEKKLILQFGKTYFLYHLFWATPLDLHFKDDL